MKETLKKVLTGGFCTLGLSFLIFGFLGFKREACKHTPKIGLNVVYSTKNLNLDKENEALLRIKDIGIELVSFNVRYFQETDTSSTINKEPIPDLHELSKLINYSKKIGLETSMRPIIESKNKGSRERFNPGNINGWFEDYSEILMNLSEFSEQHKIENIYVATELDSIFSKNLDKSNILIDKIRKKYSGKISYSFNFPLLDTLFLKKISQLNTDFFGIDYYINLAQKRNSSTHWENYWYFEQINKYITKPICLTEVGYRSIDNARVNPWDHTKNSSIDFQEQNVLYIGILKGSSLIRKKPNAIYFWIKDQNNLSDDIFNPLGCGYSPFGKPAEKVILDYNKKRQFFKKIGLVD